MACKHVAIAVHFIYAYPVSITLTSHGFGYVLQLPICEHANVHVLRLNFLPVSSHVYNVSIRYGKVCIIRIVIL